MSDYIDKSASVAPSIYLSHDTGIWRHVSDLFKPEWFSMLMKGSRVRGEVVENVEQWGEWLKNSKNYGSYQGNNVGRTVFEKLVAEGHAPNLPKGILSPDKTHQYVDYATKTGENIQLKHSLGGKVWYNFKMDLSAGKYSPANNVDGVGVNKELYQELVSNPEKYGFIETSQGSGIAVDPRNGTRLLDSGLDEKTSRDILLKTQDYARENLEAFDISEHIAMNSLKAAGIAGLITFAIKGSMNLYKYHNGKMRGDDAVDNTVGSSIKAAVAGGLTTLVTGTTMAVIGIPTAGLGLAVAIPVGVASGAVISKAVNSAFDSVYMDLMGGEYVQMAREQNKVFSMLFDQFENQYSIAQEYQKVLNNAASQVEIFDIYGVQELIDSSEAQLKVGNLLLEGM